MTDEIGSYIWKLCDGKHTTRQIIEALHQEFKLSMEETETGLQTYLTKLSKKGLVGFILSDGMKARFEES